MADLHHQALSITAVFVALAVGVAAGAAAVGGRLGTQGELVAQLERQFAALQVQLVTAATKERQTQATLHLYEQALNRLIPALASRDVAGLVVRVEASQGASEAAAAVVRLLTQSGARVERVQAPEQAVPPFVVIRTSCRSIAGLVGSAPAGQEGRLPPHLAALAAPPAAWVWQAESALGRLALVVALVEGHKGYVSIRRAMENLDEFASGLPGERGGACL